MMSVAGVSVCCPPCMYFAPCKSLRQGFLAVDPVALHRSDGCRSAGQFFFDSFQTVSEKVVLEHVLIEVSILALYIADPFQLVLLSSNLAPEADHSRHL